MATDKSKPEHWRVTLSNPPINAIDDQMYDEFYDLVGEIEANESSQCRALSPDFPAGARGLYPLARG
jgi:enoyl-CoA hydratase/carnithine racemase